MTSALTFMAFQLGVLGGQQGAAVQSVGVAEQWTAPLAWYSTRTGFGDEAWVDRQADTVIAWRCAGGEVTCNFGASRGRRLAGKERAITLQPAGTPNHFWAPGGVEFAQFYIPPALLTHVGERLGGRAVGIDHLRDDLQFVADDLMFEELERYRARAMSDAERPTRLEMEARALLIVERLLTQHHGFLARRERRPPRDWRLRRAIELIDAQLSQDIGLATLAAAVDLSPSHLTSLFRAGTGAPPHRWLVRRRVERGCEMLADTQLSVTEIALACGFASSQHFATAFRKHMGVTPREFRQQRLA